MSRVTIRFLACCALAPAATACGTTVDEPAGEAPPPVEGGVIVDEAVPPTTIPVEGSASALLPEMVIEMSRLGSQIAEGGDDEATLARIAANWEAIREEVAETRPGLVNGINATVDMARTAVERTSPADADQAFTLLTDLVDDFYGE